MNKMFNAFTQEYPSTKIKLSTYRKVVNKYNIGWYKPKNDLCRTCTAYDNSEKSPEQIKAYTENRRHINESRQLKEEDKLRAKSDTTFEALICDMEAVRPCPKAQSG